MSEQFRFDLFPLIQTERFILRSAEAGDSHDLLALYSDEAVVQYMPFTPFESVEDAQGEMNWYTKIFKEHTGLRWMIEDRETRKVIGTCGFLNYEDVHNRAEIGYDLRSSFWGRGVMTEVARAVLHFDSQACSSTRSKQRLNRRTRRQFACYINLIFNRKVYCGSMSPERQIY